MRKNIRNRWNEIVKLQEQFDAITEARRARAAVRLAHIALRNAGLSGCAEALDATIKACEAAGKAFHANYCAVQEGLTDEDDLAELHEKVFGKKLITSM